MGSYAGAAEASSPPRAVARIARFAAITTGQVGRASLEILRHGRSAHHSARALQRWSARLVGALGVRATARGDPPPPGVLLVANHRSYIDIAVIGARAPCSFLAKEEVSRWPILGFGARRCGNIVFVRRDDLASRRKARGAVARVLEAGVTVVVFPEGTTFRGPGTLPFKRGIFRMASEGGFPVAPVALDYEDPDDAWVGEDTFVRHFLRVFSRKTIRVGLTFGPVLRGNDADRLRESAREWIDQTLRPPASLPARARANL